MPPPESEAACRNKAATGQCPLPNVGWGLDVFLAPSWVKYDTFVKV